MFSVNKNNTEYLEKNNFYTYLNDSSTFNVDAVKNIHKLLNTHARHSGQPSPRHPGVDGQGNTSHHKPCLPHNYLANILL